MHQPIIDTQMIHNAKLFCLASKYVSTSSLQRHLHIGYRQATVLVQRLIDEQFYEANYITPHGYPIYSTQ